MRSLYITLLSYETGGLLRTVLPRTKTIRDDELIIASGHLGQQRTYIWYLYQCVDRRRTLNWLRRADGHSKLHDRIVTIVGWGRGKYQQAFPFQVGWTKCYSGTE